MARKSKMAIKGGRAISRKSRPGMKPRRPLGSKGTPGQSASTVPNKPKVKIKHVQGVVQGGAGAHVAVFDTGSHQSMLGRYGWDIINNHDKWIDTRGVDLGGTSKTGRRLQLVDARGVVKNLLDGNSYLVIIRQAFFNSNSDETLLAEDQIECNCVQVFSRPRVFGGDQKVVARDQVGRVVHLAIE